MKAGLRPGEPHGSAGRQAWASGQLGQWVWRHVQVAAWAVGQQGSWASQGGSRGSCDALAWFLSTERPGPFYSMAAPGQCQPGTPSPTLNSCCPQSCTCMPCAAVPASQDTVDIPKAQRSRRFWSQWPGSRQPSCLLGRQAALWAHGLGRTSTSFFSQDSCPQAWGKGGVGYTGNPGGEGVAHCTLDKAQSWGEGVAAISSGTRSLHGVQLL